MTTVGSAEKQPPAGHGPKRWGLVLTAIGIGVMAIVAPFDYRWTLFLREHRWRALKDFLGRSLFEGEGLGGGDPVVGFLLAVVLLYYLAWRRPNHRRLAGWRPQLGFGVMSAVVCGIYLVHGLKWALGRARPYEVIKEHLAYSAWYEFGPHFLTQGIYHGSFPSGHTVQVFLLFSLAYMLSGDRQNLRPVRAAGRLWGLLVLVYTLMMGIGRCMSLSHWVSDVVGGVILAWIVMHLLYHHVCRVPHQVSVFDEHGHRPQKPAVWELRLCFWLLPISLGLLGIVIGARALGRQEALWLGLLIPAGIAAVVAGLKGTTRLYRQVWPCAGKKQ